MPGGDGLSAPVARRGLLFVLSSPSGAGKTTMARRLLASDGGIALSVSVTTRPPRPGEENGGDYHFVDQPGFDRLVADGAFLEHARVFDHGYGTPRAPVAAALEDGRDVLFDIDWQGTRQLAASPMGEDVVSVYLLPPSMAELRRRLEARGTDSRQVIAGRMARAAAEISHWPDYGYVLVNDAPDACFDLIRCILHSERQRRERQPGLAGFVRDLLAAEP